MDKHQFWMLIGCIVPLLLIFLLPLFGISGNYEGDKAVSELPHSVYRIAPDGKLDLVTAELNGPNGLAFSPDEKKLYIVEGRAQPNRLVWSYDVGAGATLTNKTKLIDANGPGSLDGFRVDVDGNLWCGWGMGSDELDGVRIFNSASDPIGHIKLPERAANLCFGGRYRNLLFMAASHWLYALYTNAQGVAGG